MVVALVADRDVDHNEEGSLLVHLVWRHFGGFELGKMIIISEVLARRD